MSRRSVLDILICSILLSGLYAARGCYLASVTGGRYPLGGMVVDVLMLGSVVVGLRLLDMGVRALVRRVLGETTRWRVQLGVVVQWMVVFVVAAPFLMALFQLCPQRMACTGNPSDLGIPFSEVTLESEGLRLSGWFIPATDPSRPVVLIAHGVGANKQNFLPAAQAIYELGFHALIFDFRAHGDSDGRITTFGYREAEDVKAAHEWITKHCPGRPIYALGYSMGGTAVIRAAAEDGCFERIVLDNTFGSAERVARSSLLWIFGPLKTPVWHLGRLWGRLITGVDLGQHRPEQLMPLVADRPLLLIHGTGDSVIPYTETLRLQEAAGGSGELWLIKGLGHNQAIDHPAYKARLRAFFDGPQTSPNS